LLWDFDDDMCQRLLELAIPMCSHQYTDASEGLGVLNDNFVTQITHMPPELLTEGRLSKAADVFAFGAGFSCRFCCV